MSTAAATDQAAQAAQPAPRRGRPGPVLAAGLAVAGVVFVERG